MGFLYSNGYGYVVCFILVAMGFGFDWSAWVALLFFSLCFFGTFASWRNQLAREKKQYDDYHAEHYWKKHGR